jgi:hypothetical protein
MILAGLFYCSKPFMIRIVVAGGYQCGKLDHHSGTVHKLSYFRLSSIFQPQIMAVEVQSNLPQLARAMYSPLFGETIGLKCLMESLLKLAPTKTCSSVHY